MPAIHENALRTAYDAAVAKEPAWEARVNDVRDRIRSGRYPKNLVDAIYQRAPISAQKSGARGALLDAFGFSLIWAHIMSGELALAIVEVGSVPNRDADVAGNQAKLGGVPRPFIARFQPETGRGAEDDGRLEWTAPIELDRTIVDSSNVAHQEKWTVPPRFIPLEVGTTAVSRTLLHVRQSGVARWAYRSTEIVILLPHPSMPRPRLW